MSMFIRVKRAKQTIFLHVEPTDTVLEVKQKLQELVDKLPEELKLVKVDSPLDHQGMELEDAKKLADFRVENDNIVAMCYATGEGEYEPITIEEFTPPKM